MKQNFILLFLCGFIFQACSSSYELTSKENLILKIDNRFNDTLFAHAFWGVKIESLESGEILYEKNADKMFMPASNEKIPTAASALLFLGPDFKFETNLYFSGEIVDSVLNGDLIVEGNGDPTFYTRFYDNPRDPFFEWAELLKTQGIKKINGNIIGDDNAFDDNHLGMGWSHGGLDVWYSAEFGALQFNENYVDLNIIPPKTIADTVQIIPNVESCYYKINKNISVTDSGRNLITVNRPFNSNQINVSGKIVAGSKNFERSPTIHNPTLFYVTVFMETLEHEGIHVDGYALDCDDIEKWDMSKKNVELFHTHYSPPLFDILEGLMKRSQNLYAETLVRAMGHEHKELGTFENGKEVVENTLAGFGIEPNTYSYQDGSGLSRYNYISPNQIVKILKGMRNSEHWQIWRDIQPVAGVDGTLRRRMIGTKAEGNVRAKTGTISNVRGLSGYVTTSDNEELVFSFLVNGHLRSSRDTELVTDKVLEILASYKK